MLSLQLCPTLCDPMDCSRPGSSVHGILQAEYLEGLAVFFARGLSDPGIFLPRDRTRSSTLQADSLLTEPPGKSQNLWDSVKAVLRGKFRKGRGTRDQIANIRWIIKKARQLQKNIYFCLTDYAKAIDCVDHNKLWKILKEMGIPGHLTCLLRNLYTGQEAAVRTGHGTADWF